MLHYFHPNVLLLLILPEKTFLGYYAPVFIVHYFLSTELWLSQTFADTLPAFRLQPEKEHLWIVFCCTCISINAPGKAVIFSLVFLKVLFSVPCPQTIKWKNLGRKRQFSQQNTHDCIIYYMELVLKCWGENFPCSHLQQGILGILILLLFGAL